MIEKKNGWARVDEDGRLVLSPEIANRFGLKPGATLRLEENSNTLRLSRPVSHLAKVYVEPASHCNLKCSMCLHNVWDEPQGWMSDATFSRLLQGLRRLAYPPLIFFGGFGEPLTHPHLVDMISQVRPFAGRVELITNATLLTEDLSRGLVSAGLDTLWVSIDSAIPEMYAGLRSNAALPSIFENIAHFRRARGAGNSPRPEIGLVFVAMKRNIADLPVLLRLSIRLGISRYLVTNVLPYTQDMCDEILYTRSLNDTAYSPSFWCPHLDMPRIDANADTRQPLYQVFRAGHGVSLAGVPLDGATARCPFIEKGSTAISWNGDLSPCLPLMHDSVSYLYKRPRHSRPYRVGNLSERGLGELWEDPGYLAFRERVQAFDFSPCTVCGGCDLSEDNQEDCFGNTFPTCGGCLWAQGLIQCP